MIKIWKSWVNITKKLANLFAEIVLTIIFFLLILPVSIFIKIFTPSIFFGHDIKTSKNSFWIKRNYVKYDLKYAAEQ